VKLRVSSSIVNFRDKAEKTWGLERYCFPWDIFKPIVFFGMYHIGDYFHYFIHRGKKTIVWAGSDIQTLLKSIFPWYLLFRNAKHYCENGVERAGLLWKGIDSEIKPSFLEDINDFPVCFYPPKVEKAHVFITGHMGREDEYGWNIVEKIATSLPNIVFHIYGTDIQKSPCNIIYHGRVSNKQFNKDIKSDHCGLRLNEHDGFSEVLAKSVLMGQYPISRIKYPHIWNYETEEELLCLLEMVCKREKPNLIAREFWRKNVNNYDFIKER